MEFDLHSLQESKIQISISRSGIDSFRIRGFILGFSKKILLIQYVSDIRLDGIMALSLNDITEIQQDKTDVFQTQLLKDEGVYKTIDFDKKYKFTSWKSFLETLELKNKIISIEDETSEFPIHEIGVLKKIKRKSLSVKSFTGAANWQKGKTVMYYEEISALQVESNYLKTYERHFQRNP